MKVVLGRSNSRKLALLTFWIISCLAMTSNAQSYSASIIALPAINGHASGAYGTNSSGAVAGYSFVSSSSFHSTVWQNGLTVDLGKIGGWGSMSNSINDLGQVVGRSWLGSTQFASDSHHAALWDNGTIVDLGTLGGDYSEALKINNNGQIVGYSYTSSGPAWIKATLWQNGAIVDLGTLDGGSISRAYSINDIGVIVGASSISNGTARPIKWENGVMQDIGTVGEGNGFAKDINNQGHIVGESDIPGEFGYHAVLWKDNSIIDLGTLGGNLSWASAINEKGQVVGYSDILCTNPMSSCFERAFLWENGNMFDLNNFEGVSGSGWLLRNAYDINENGQIVGWGYLNGEQTGFLLTLSPVPEPINIALMLSGLGIIAVRKRLVY